MLTKTALIAAAASTVAMIPAAAQAQTGYYGSGYDSRYDRGYDSRYNRGSNSNYGTDQYGRAYTYDRYGNRVYSNNRYSRNSGYYGQNNGRYAQNSGGYYGRTYSNNNYYGQQRCSSGTTGTVVGGAIGALLGSQIAKGGSYGYGYRSGGSGTTGAIVGGAVGALAGRAIEKGGDNCR